MDWTFEDDSLFFYVTLTGRRGHTLFVQAEAEMSDTGAKVIKPDPCSSWEGHSERVGASVGDESAESCRVVRPLRILLVIRSLRRTYKLVSRFEAPCICTWWAGERCVEQMSRLHRTAC